MAITKYDDIVAGMSNGTILEAPADFPTSYSGAAMKLLVPKSIASSTTGFICTAETAEYAPWFPLPGAGDTLLINNSLEGIGAPLLLCDLLWACNWYSGGTTWTDGTTVDFTPPDLTRYTSGDNVFLICEVSEGTGMLNSSLILYVTDNLGRTGQTMPYNMRAVDYRSAGDGTTTLWQGSFFLPPPSGAGGVRKLEQMKFMTTASITTGFYVRFGLIRPLCLLPASHGQGPTQPSFSEMCSNIIRLYRGTADDQACLIAISDSTTDAIGLRGFTLAAA